MFRNWFLSASKHSCFSACVFSHIV